MFLSRVVQRCPEMSYQSLQCHAHSRQLPCKILKLNLKCWNSQAPLMAHRIQFLFNMLFTPENPWDKSYQILTSWNKKFKNQTGPQISLIMEGRTRPYQVKSKRWTMMNCLFNLRSFLQFTVVFWSVLICVRSSTNCRSPRMVVSGSTSSSAFSPFNDRMVIRMARTVHLA